MANSSRQRLTGVVLAPTLVRSADNLQGQQPYCLPDQAAGMAAPVCASKKCNGPSKVSPMRSPGRAFRRSRKTQVMSCPANLAITCVSYPVGSITMICADIACGPPRLTCSGRTPRMISEPGAACGALLSGTLTPEAVAKVGD